MAVVSLNLSLEQFLEFIENLPKEYKKVASERLKKDTKIDLLNKKELLMKVSELNINLLNSKERIENNFGELILLYEEIGNQYEQIIHQTKEIKEALQIKEYLENIVSIANFYLEKIRIQFEKETIFLESLTNEIENIQELLQDIELKFIDIPSKTSIHEILKRI